MNLIDKITINILKRCLVVTTVDDKGENPCDIELSLDEFGYEPSGIIYLKA